MNIPYIYRSYGQYFMNCSEPEARWLCENCVSCGVMLLMVFSHKAPPCYCIVTVLLLYCYGLLLLLFLLLLVACSCCLFLSLHPSIPIHSHHVAFQGLLNNGDGCLTTHLSDIGLFVDGRPVQILEAMVTSWGGTNVGNEAPGSTTN